MRPWRHRPRHADRHGPRQLPADDAGVEETIDDVDIVGDGVETRHRVGDVEAFAIDLEQDLVANPLGAPQWPRQTVARHRHGERRRRAVRRPHQQVVVNARVVGLEVPNEVESSFGHEQGAELVESAQGFGA